MFNIKDFLKRFQKFATDEIGTRTTISDALKEIVGVSIPIENISYKNETITLRVEGVVKNELYIKKQKILKVLQHTLPHLRDIRFS